MNLFAECYIEIFICEYLGYRRNQVIKSSGKPGVLNDLRKQAKQNISIGFVDEDPTKTKDKDYYNYKTVVKEFSITLLKKNNNKHYLIELENEFEPWILKMNVQAKIKPEKYNVDITRLHEYNAQVNIPKNYLNFYKAIFQAYPQPINKISQWIKQVNS